ncbi:MAG: TetR/AcrR family transcriptional regulator [Pseudoruegeria sp.]
MLFTGMARPREFDTDTVIAKAMDVFWEHGYADATLPILLSGMNLTRGSLYKAFTDKKTLFLEVLNTYDGQAVDGAVTLLTTPGQSGWLRIFEVFGSIVSAVESGDQRGCLLCSAIAGPAAYDLDIAASTTASLNKIRAAFKEALSGSVKADDIDAFAELLVTQYVGMQILARTNESNKTLQQNIKTLRLIAKTMECQP